MGTHGVSCKKFMEILNITNLINESEEINGIS
jgi:hypothetical protein